MTLKVRLRLKVIAFDFSCLVYGSRTGLLQSITVTYFGNRARWYLQVLILKYFKTLFMNSLHYKQFGYTHIFVVMLVSCLEKRVPKHLCVVQITFKAVFFLQVSLCWGPQTYRGYSMQLFVEDLRSVFTSPCRRPQLDLWCLNFI